MQGDAEGAARRQVLALGKEMAELNETVSALRAEKAQLALDAQRKDAVVVELQRSLRDAEAVRPG